MSATKYTYSISTDFPNAKVESTRLTQEIQASAIVVALDRIDTAGDVCDIWFKDSLSEGDQTVLSGIVAAHSGEPIEDITVARVQLYTNNEPVPASPDGRPIIAPIAFPNGQFVYVAGAGDHRTNGRGEGNRFNLSRSTAGEDSVEWQYNDPVWVTGGNGHSIGGAVGDEISFEVYAPATTVESVTPGTGTAILYDTGFLVPDGNGGTTALMSVVPYAGGTHNVLEAIPVPASVGEPSVWVWVPPATGVGLGDVIPQASGGWNLYTAPIPLARQASHIQLLGDQELSVDVGNVQPLIALPQWMFRAVLTTAGTRDVAVVWSMKTARYRTTKIW